MFNEFDLPLVEHESNIPESTIRNDGLDSFRHFFDVFICEVFSDWISYFVHRVSRAGFGVISVAQALMVSRPGQKGGMEILLLFLWTNQEGGLVADHS